MTLHKWWPRYLPLTYNTNVAMLAPTGLHHNQLLLYSTIKVLYAMNPPHSHPQHTPTIGAQNTWQHTHTHTHIYICKQNHQRKERRRKYLHILIVRAFRATWVITSVSLENVVCVCLCVLFFIYFFKGKNSYSLSLTLTTLISYKCFPPFLQ